MRIGVLTVQVPFVHGGAEMHAASLVAALRAAGHEAEILSMPFRWFPPDRMVPQILASRLLDVTESAGRPIDRVIGLKFPAYLAPHPDKVLWLLHQHRSAYDLWRHPLGDLHGQPGGDAAMRAVREADGRFIPEARRIFTNSRRVSDRLRAFCGIEGTPLHHPPPGAERFAAADGPAETEPFLLMPSRINPAKRQDLVARALALVSGDVRVVVIGSTDAVSYAEDLARMSALLPPGRLVIRGAVDENEKVALYRRCRGVLYVPVDEDYGYVSLEAMLAAKPVITCTDSGGTLEFVVGGETGLVVPPDAAALADAIDALWASPSRAAEWGRAGREAYTRAAIGWDEVVACLTG